MSKIRVLVIEDSLTVRMYLIGVLRRDAAIEVVGAGSDGRQAVDLCRELRPDVVTLDVMMPRLDGVGATRQIMAFCPTPILIVSASCNRGDVYKTFDALAAGALDVIDKPCADESNEAWEGKFLDTVKLVSHVKVITHPLGRLRPTREPPSPAPQAISPPALGDSAHDGRYRLVAIGASTGGPGAVRTILSALPPSFPLPILIVIHISRPFGPGLLEWLAGESKIPVRAVVSGDPLPPPGQPVVLLAPPDRHLVVSGGQVRLTLAPERLSCRPSVDVLFESVALELGQAAIACLLTGMGRDGAEGLLAVRHAGGATFAQDQATSVIFGMPGEAIRLDAAERVLPLSAIAPALGDIVSHRRAQRR